MAHDSTDLGARLIKGVSWTGFSQFARLGTGLTGLVVISRFVSPDQVGLAAMALIILGVANSIATLGPAQALVQRPAITDNHAAAAFQLTLLIGISLALLVIVGANGVASVFHDPRVAHVLRIGAIGIPISILPASQMALLQRAMRFREYAIVATGSAVLATSSAMVLAISGAGVWAVLASQLLFGGFAFVMVQFYVPWHGATVLRVREIGELFSYGANTSLGVVTGYIAQNLPNFFVGRFFNAHTLGFYSMSFRSNDISFKQLQTAFTSTMLPALASVQQSPERLRSLFVQSTRLGIIFTAPPLLVFTVASLPVVEVLLGPKWLPAADILWRLSLAQIIFSIGMNVSTVFQAIGRPQYGWMWNLLCTVMYVPSYLYAVRYGATGVASATAALSPIMTVILILWIRHVLSLTAADIWKMLSLPSLVLCTSSAAAFAMRALLERLGISPIITLAATILAGACVYFPMIHFADPRLFDHIRRLSLGRFFNRRAT